MKSCIDCGRLTERSRCPKHETAADLRRQRRQPWRKGYEKGAYRNVRVVDVWEADGGICQICFEPCTLDDATKDHIVPLRLGGSNDADNLRLAHKSCNSRRGGKSRG